MLSPEVDKIVEQAFSEASSRRHEFATVEHLCLALLEHERINLLLEHLGVSKNELRKRFVDFIDHQIDSLPEGLELETMPSLGLQRVLQRAAVHIASAGKTKLSVEHVLVAAFDEDESYAVYILQQAGVSRLDLVSLISHGSLSTYEHDNDNQADLSDEEEENKSHKLDTLARFTLCLTDEARKSRLDQLIGREREINRAIQVLSRRRKNNPLFVGEPGVGKTALAEGLAQAIVEKKVPDYLLDAQVYLLDIGAMLAGARYRGDFENRMKSVLKALAAKPNAIMVIDEIHTIVGAGATSGGSMDAANLLKPILSSGHLRCVGSTTYKEYRSYFEKDRALARRFQKIDVNEPSEEECLRILLGIKKRYEDFHGLSISEQALSLAVKLSMRFLHERKLPDKAIDVIDEACARLRLLKNSTEPAVSTVDDAAIEEAVASMAQIPSQNLSHDDKLALAQLEAKLKETVFGQDQAIEHMSNAILLSRAGLREKEKPIGCFLFTGPSGVGKTELARQLALNLGLGLLRFDMSEYMERHAASRLVGAPPGYVGYEQGGLLTDAINKNPHVVLLLDEIEKAHSDVFNMLLQVMDYAKLTDTSGRVSDFRHVILIMTSNVGAREREHRAIGFQEEPNATKHHDKQAVKRLFSPEFRNRLDASISFNKLAQDVIIKVVDKFIKEINNQLADKNIKLKISDQARQKLAQLAYEPSMGARPLARLIQEHIKKPLAHEVLFGQLLSGGEVVIELVEDKIVLLIS